MSRGVLRLLGPALALALASAPEAGAKIVDRVAAVVNKDVITLSEIYDEGGEFIEEAAAGEGEDGPRRREIELEVLDALIRQSLIDQEMRRLNLSVTREELDRAIDEVGRRNGLDPEALRRELVKIGMDWQTYRDQMESDLARQKFAQAVLMPRINVNEDEVRDLYNRRLRDLDREVSRSLEIFVLPWDPATVTPEEKAALATAGAEIRTRVAEGAGWTEASGALEGSLIEADFARTDLDETTAAAAFGAQIGEVVGPIATLRGLFIVKVVASNLGEPPEFEVVRSDLEMELSDIELQREMELWYVQARRQASVEIKLEPPE